MEIKYIIMLIRVNLNQMSVGLTDDESQKKYTIDVSLSTKNNATSVVPKY